MSWARSGQRCRTGGTTDRRNSTLPKNMSDGILNLDKPSGPTSHDVVDRVRTLTGIRRVGHAGTLDPLATGVLLVCLGRATRVVEYLMEGTKTYRARVRMGITTDTYDAEGSIVTESPVQVSRAQVETGMAHFRGVISQLPPMYSAVKHQGTPLHRLARQGIHVDREPRRVEVYRLELTAWEPPECTIEVDCSQGTYVRTLAHDLGHILGCGAHLTALARLASGGFKLEDAISLQDLEKAAAEDRWTDLLQPIDAALVHLPELRLDEKAARRICSGQGVASEGAAGPDDLARAYSPDGTFLALAAYDAKHKVWRPRKVFQQPGPSAPGEAAAKTEG